MSARVYDDRPRGVAGIVTVAVPRIPYPGASSDAEFYLSAAQHVRGGYVVGGSNLSACVATLLERVAGELEPTPAEAAEGRQNVEEALRAADAGNAGHWETVATILAAEVRRLRLEGHVHAPWPGPCETCGATL
jgi:hypothetical protein